MGLFPLCNGVFLFLRQLCHSCYEIHRSLRRILIRIISWRHLFSNFSSLNFADDSGNRNSSIILPLISSRFRPLNTVWKFFKNSALNQGSRCLDQTARLHFPIWILLNISDRYYTWLYLKAHYFCCLLLPLQRHIFASKLSGDWLIMFSAEQQLFRPGWKKKNIWF